jgi:hexosaminidase
MRLLFASFVFVFFTVSVTAQPINIIPQPASVKQPAIAASFTLSPTTVIVLEGSNLEKIAGLLNSYLKQFYSFQLKVVKNSVSKNSIRFNYERLDNLIAGAYNMEVNEKGIYIAGDNENGVFYGFQTLIQLLPVPESGIKTKLTKLAVPYVEIEDAPRFAYRGMHLDVARHYFPLSFIKKYIDYLALHKLNTFHWHLTDDQGWRIEIKKYPKLTQVGSKRNGTIIGRYPGKGSDNKPDSGFYTQAQVKEIVKYAADRYITVIPEIEMPGHASAAIAAYPQLSCFPNEKTMIPEKMSSEASKKASGKLVQETWGVFEDVFAPTDYTFNFLQNVLNEVMVLFPSQYIHIGGDECPKEAWKRSAFCQQLIKEKGLKDEHGLQSYFIQHMEKYLNSKGKKIIGWDEILEGGLAPNATVMSWRGEAGGIEAAKQKHDVIMTPGNPVYFDHTQSENEDSVTIGGYNPIEKVYAYEPIPKELTADEAKYVLGAQANVWTEYMNNPAKVEYMIFPRMAALSEILWTAKEKKNWDDFEKRLQVQFKRYDFWKANYSRAFFDLKMTVLPTENFQGVLWKLEKKSKEGKIVYAWGANSFTIPYENPILVLKTETYTGLVSLDGKIINGEGESFHFNKATGKKITLANEASKNYPGDGAFTLVNGVQNEKGLAKSKEFLGFSGTNCEAVIDFGSDTTTINEIIIHTLEQTGSWIYFPSAFDISKSADGITFSPLGTEVQMSRNSEKNRATIKLTNPINTRFLKINILNAGTIPSGQPGAGNKAWLFVDEIEIN